jgi:hypothetical protein
MEQWSLNPIAFPAIVSAVATSLAVGGLILTICSMRSELAENRRARILEAVLHISDDFRKRWESSWGAILRDEVPQLNLEEREQGRVGTELSYMLNWLDWMGLMMRLKLIDIDLLQTLWPPMKEIITQSAYQIHRDIQQHGHEWWFNVEYVAKHPKINIDIEEAAKRLEAQWLSTAHQNRHPDLRALTLQI